MLRGHIIYRDEHLGEVLIDVLGVDNYNDTKFHLYLEDMSNYTNYTKFTQLLNREMLEPVTFGVKDGVVEGRVTQAIEPHYNPEYTNSTVSARRIDIKRTNKFKTNVINREFSARVSAILRYMQITGVKNYNVGIVDREDYFNKERYVEIEGFGNIMFTTGLMNSLSVKSKYVDIHLEPYTLGVENSGMFQELKEKDNYGNTLSPTPVSNVAFKLDESTLGFPYVSNVVKGAINSFGMYETIEDVIEAHPDKNTSWILDRQYEIVTDENLERVIKEFMDFDGHIAFDTETTGLKINFKSRTGEADELVGVVLTKDLGTGYYFPLQHKLFKNLCGGDHWFFMERYMKKLLETKKIVCHNIKFDWKVAYIYDINVNCVFDTMIALGVTKRYEEDNYSLGLKTITKNIFGLDMFDLHDFVASGSFGDEITFADLPYELVRRYAPADTDMTLSLFKWIKDEKIIEKYDAKRVFNLECWFARCVAYSEFFGYRVDIDNSAILHKDILEGMEKWKNIMFEIAGREFNPNSSQQLSAIMYDELGIEMIGGKRSTAKESLKALDKRTNPDGSPRYPFVKALKKYRENEGIYKNFLKKLPEFTTEDGFIFPEVQQLGTTTGRSSVKNPNYQGYNDPVKKNIVPRPGFFHFDCDFSQIEYRVLASIAQQEQLIHAFNDPDLDYHTYQASRMFGIPYALVPKDLRSQSKTINFGLPYGMGDSSLGQNIFGERNDVNTAKAGHLRIKFFQGQERIQEFFDITRNLGASNGFTSTYYGRRRYYNRAKFTVAQIRRQAGNHVIQGTAADLYKDSCVRLFRRIMKEGWLGKVLFDGFIHDEVLLEVHESINPYYFFKAWREEFQLPIDGFCELFAGAGVGYNWYQAKKQDLPAQYIEEIISKADDNQKTWTGTFATFLKDVEDGHEEYKARRVKEHIVDTVNDGQVIKPIINTLLVEEVGKIVTLMQNKNPEVIDSYNTAMGGIKIPMVGEHSIKEFKDLLLVFCSWHRIDVNSVVVVSAEDADISKSEGVQMEDIPLEFSEDTYSIKDYLDMRGYFLDDNSDIVYMLDKTVNYKGVSTSLFQVFNTEGVFKAEAKYQIATIDNNTQEFVYYSAYIDVKGYDFVQSMYNQLLLV